MSWLLDTNVVSEIRKGPRGDPGVIRWTKGRDDDVWLSVITVGEIRRGVELKRRRDEVAARHLDLWLEALVTSFSSRILPVDQRIAEAWAILNLSDPRPVLDGLIAATAVVHGLTLVTRNTKDFDGAVVRLFNPFEQ